MTRATERDLIDLSDYIKDLGITKKSLEIDIREALVKAYQTQQEAPTGRCAFYFFFVVLRRIFWKFLSISVLFGNLRVVLLLPFTCLLLQSGFDVLFFISLFVFIFCGL